METGFVFHAVAPKNYINVLYRKQAQLLHTTHICIHTQVHCWLSLYLYINVLTDHNVVSITQNSAN